MEPVTNNKPQNQKVGKRISTDDLIKYIKIHKEGIKNVKYIDLNDVPEQKNPTSLEKAYFQNIVEVNYLPKNLSEIFKLNESNKKYLHGGCLKTINFRNNKYFQISFFSSIISCLKQSFFSATISDQTIFITKLINRLMTESSGVRFTEFAYKKRYDWKKTDVQEDMGNNLFGPNIMKYVSDYFHINIFILDLDRDLLFFGGDEYVPYKRTLFLFKYPDGVFEPLFIGNSRAFTVDSDLIKEIRDNPDYVNVYNMTNKMSLGFEEMQEELIFYKPKKDKVKIKIEKPEEAYDKKKQEKIKEQAKKDKEKKESAKKNVKVEDSEESQNSDEKYDEDMNAYSEDSTEENEEDNKKIKQLSDNNDEEKEEKPVKATKKTIKNKSVEKESKTKYNIKDIKSTLKVAELKEIAKELGITIGKKTKDVLIEEIKNKLTKS